MSKFEGRGKFWFPGSLEKVMTGSIKFNPSVGSNVYLEEILDDNLHQPLLHYDIILGRLEDGTSITLIDCDEMKFEMKPRRIHEFEVKIIIRGEHFQSVAEVMFGSMKIHFTHLPEWLGLWNRFMYPVSSTFNTTTFRFKDFTVTLDADPKMTNDIETIGYESIKRVNDRTFVKLQPTTKKHYNEFMNIINGLRELLMFATSKDISLFFVQGSILCDDKKSEERLLDIYYKVKDYSSDHVFSPIPCFLLMMM